LWSQYWLPEPLLHDLRMQVRHQQMRCMGMAQVVQAHAPQAACFDELDEGAG
jgi:hypothetical protein